jgi:hypothetical protein
MKHCYSSVLIGLIAAALLAGCAPTSKPDSDKEGPGDEWTVIENTEAVKPQAGIASRIIALKGYDIIDWIDDETILAYQYSDTVFGDDRGLVALDWKSGQILRRYDAAGTYFDGRVSPDKKILAYTTKGNGVAEVQFNLLDLESGKTQSYRNQDLQTLYQFDVYMFYRNFRWHSGQDAWVTLRSTREAMVFASLENSGIEFITVPFGAIVKEPQYVYMEYYSKMEDAVYGILHDAEKSRFIKVQVETGKLTELPLQNVVNVWPLVEQQQLLVIQKPVNQSVATVILADADGRKVKTLAQIDHLTDIEVAGEVMVYQTQREGTEATLGLLNLETGVQSYITAYQQLWLGKMKLSPNGTQLLVDFEYGGPTEQGKPISHILQLK